MKIGLRLRLIQLNNEKKEFEKAEIAYKCLQRLIKNSPGRPTYNSFSWESLEYFLDAGPSEEDFKN